MDLQEIHRVLQSHKEHILCNRASLFNLATKIHDIENQIVVQLLEIKSCMVALKQRLEVVEVQRNVLWNLTGNLCKGA
jgi:hypothetical protein